MAKIEIDENEYAELKRVAGVAELIGKNPEARVKLQEAVGIAAPDQAGPEIRIRKEVTERLSGIEKKFDEFMSAQAKDREDREADAAKRDLERRWLDGRGVARNAGYTDDGLEKLEAYMEKEGIASHKIAMAAFERENPPPEPIATGNSRWNFFDQRDQGNLGLDKLMAGDDEAFLAEMIPAALKDVRG